MSTRLRNQGVRRRQYSSVTARAGSLSRTPARLRSSFEACSLRWRHEPQEEEAAAAAVGVWLFSRLFGSWLSWSRIFVRFAAFPSLWGVCDYRRRRSTRELCATSDGPVTGSVVSFLSADAGGGLGSTAARVLGPPLLVRAMLQPRPGTSTRRQLHEEAKVALRSSVAPASARLSRRRPSARPRRRPAAFRRATTTMCR